MKSLITFALAASLAVEAVAQPHHDHRGIHRSLKRRAASKVRREPAVVTEWVASSTETVYKLDGETISKEEADKGLKNGDLVIIGETTPKIEPEQGAQFYEKKPETTSTPTPTPTPEPTPEPSQSSSSGGKGLTAEFPSGTIPCSQFPSDYGAIPISYLGTGGWTGIQRCPSYKSGDSSISYIETGIKGDGCVSGAFCSYACPPGYQKTQWPKAQGSTLQSIGGLYCNSDGYLELTRANHPTLCEEGAGGVFIQNDLDQVVSTCRTDYPGTEAMVIPTVLNPGEKQPLTNPSSSSYYVWNDMPTTAQYYVNKKGVSVEDGCVWDSSSNHDERGNWAPVNIGTGKSSDGITYLSIFPNSPTTSAKLDFNIEITGDVSIKCKLVNGAYTNGNSAGCTTAIRDGGVAIIRYYQ
ncbi:hypothetical protein jhhlp_007329 [Lomentospora prolificans]|uniref:SUN domain-containing protein n=1 Tax=Lomentospora prolificans TaxID=41688 RepID=A0A2N3N2C7_9PEZI|nr:hypothetical protein jhhlp_007329 [Lomentospora prolificans]